jgi:hypothetical protein
LRNTFISSGAMLAPGRAGSAPTATAANTAFTSGFGAGLNIGQIEAGAPAFSPPTFVNAANGIQYPTYQE